MEDLAAADAALDALNGYELDGRRITVEKVGFIRCSQLMNL